MSFDGFRDEGFQFFKDLAENNTEEWFEQNEEVYEEQVLKPCRQLVDSMREFLTDLNPELKPKKDSDFHLSAIERKGDAIPDAGPFKTIQYVYFWNTKIARLTDACLHVAVGAEGVGMGFSIYEYGRNRRARINQIFKPRILNDLEMLDNYIKSTYLRRGFTFHRYAKAPGRLGIREVDAFPTQATDWEDTLGWVVSRHLHTGSSRLTPGSFVSELQETYARLYPLYLFSSDPRVDWKREFKKHF